MQIESCEKSIVGLLRVALFIIISRFIIVMSSSSPSSVAAIGGNIGRSVPSVRVNADGAVRVGDDDEMATARIATCLWNHVCLGQVEMARAFFLALPTDATGRGGGGERAGGRQKKGKRARKGKTELDGDDDEASVLRASLFSHATQQHICSPCFRFASRSSVQCNECYSSDLPPTHASHSAKCA